MTWREALICRILLIIARLVTDDPARSQLRKTGAQKEKTIGSRP